MNKYIFEKIVEECADSSDSDSSFFSSSESSESSDNDDIVILAASKNKKNCIETYVEKIIPKYSEQEFVMHFRVTRDVFEMLCNKFQLSEEFQKLDERKVYSVKMHLALFLWFTGHEACSIRDIGDRFNVSIGTVSQIITRVIYFISRMSNIYIKWPDAEGKRNTSEYIKNKTGLSGVIGAIDGTHFRVDIAKGLRDHFIDRKNVVSIQMQGICNEKRKFLDMFVGFPGSAHDSRVLQNSDIYPKLPTLCGEYYILGDSAYACSNYIVTPYKDNGHLSSNQKFFNRKLSSGRVMIEHAFGLLKQRFRQLYHCKLKGIEKFCHFVGACVVLHNLCDDNLEVVDTEAVINNEDVQSEIPIVRDGALRNRLCEALNAHS